MRWIKKWSFVIVLMITGIAYYRMDEGLLKANFQEDMDQLGDEKPWGDWWFLHAGENEQGDVAGDGQEGLPGRAQGDAPDTTYGEGPAADDEGLAADDEGPAADVEGPAADDEGPAANEEGLADGEGLAANAEGPTPGGEGPAPGGNGAAPDDAPDATEDSPEETAEPEEPEIRMGRVEDDYFSDALFLGDSRTVGMSEFGALGKVATFYASTGMTIYKLFDAQIVEVEGQKDKVTVEEALQQQSFGKIYIMMGINEMGRGTVESFAQTFGEAVAHIRELQPDAVIYIQAILKVTKARSDKGDYINNEGIEARNEALSQLADGKTIFYLDANPPLCDEDGGLTGSYTSDGVHLKAKYISLWEEYLKDHAVLVD